MIEDQGDDGACALFPSWRHHFWRGWISGVVLVVYWSAATRSRSLAGLFYFCNSYFIFWLCASILPLGHCVVAEAECNWYLRDINIFPLSKKN